MSVRESWPKFVKTHANPYNRGLHLVGAVAGLCTFLWAYDSGSWLLILLGPAIYYASAFLGHLAFEKSSLMFFRTPVDSTLCTLRMFYHMLRGNWCDEYLKVVDAGETSTVIRIVPDEKPKKPAAKKAVRKKPAAKKAAKKKTVKRKAPAKKAPKRKSARARRYRSKQ